MPRVDFLDPISLQRSARIIDDYASTSGAAREWAAVTNHAQCGDPAKAAATIIEVATTPSPPLRHCRRHGVATLTYGSLCRGLLSGRMHADTHFGGDDLRQVDPKFRLPRYAHYLDAVARLDRFGRERYGKSVLALAVRWVLDQPGVQVALWGARMPEHLAPLDDVFGWSLDTEALRQIDAILRDAVRDPVGPEFMAPSAGRVAEEPKRLTA